MRGGVLVGFYGNGLFVCGVPVERNGFLYCIYFHSAIDQDNLILELYNIKCCWFLICNNMELVVS